MKKIVIIEDEVDIRNELAFLLEQEGYKAVVLEDFSKISQEVIKQQPDLVLLDINLPGQDGFYLCREIRKNTQIPVVFVTSRNNSMDELNALSLGGDDYITKPYNVPLLLARIKAVLRRGAPAADEALLELRGLQLDLYKGMIQHNGKEAEVTKNEMKILSYLMQRPNKIVARTELVDYLWDNQIYIDDNTLSVNITRLRAKLNELGLQDYIATKRGLGYKV